MPGSAFVFGDDAPDERIADSGTAADILKKKFPGMFSNAPVNTPANSFDSGKAIVPPNTSPDPNSIPAPDLGQQPSAMYQLPWLKQFQQAQPQKPQQINPLTGQPYFPAGSSKGQKLAIILKAGLQGAIAGRASSEQAVMQSGGRRSGGAGMGFVSGFEAPLQQTLQGQEVQRGQMQNQILQNQVANAPQIQALGMGKTLSEILKNQAESGKATAETGAIPTKEALEQAQTEAAFYKDDPNLGLIDLRTKKPVSTDGFAPLTAQEAQVLGKQPGDRVPLKVKNTANEIANRGEQLPVEQLNQGLQQRYQVLNQGQPLPPYFSLPPNATKADFDRVDKLMQQTEQAQGTKALRDQSAAIRQQTVSMAQQNQQDREEKQGLSWVSWEDSDGKTVAGPLSMARQAGAKNPAQVPTEEIRNITDARGAVRLISKQGDPGSPETMGVLQLANSLSKDGKMGVFTSRMNNFLTKGVGASPGDDPRIVTLLDKSQLLMTLAMKAHFGASGGRSPQMLEHFISMADAGKMDAQTFIGGAKAVGDYMSDRAMIPGGSGGNSSATNSKGGNAGGMPAGATMKVPGSDGKMHWSDGKKDMGVAE